MVVSKVEPQAHGPEQGRRAITNTLLPAHDDRFGKILLGLNVFEQSLRLGARGEAADADAIPIFALDVGRGDVGIVAFLFQSLNQLLGAGFFGEGVDLDRPRARRRVGLSFLRLGSLRRFSNGLGRLLSGLGRLLNGLGRLLNGLRSFLGDLWRWRRRRLRLAVRAVFRRRAGLRALLRRLRRCFRGHARLGRLRFLCRLCF
jgi:X-X-X-Leu-X-X-Gly heptad repeat protein